MKHQLITATEFKAKCLALLNEVAEEGGTIYGHQAGRPMATLGPVKRKPFKSSEGILAGKVKIVGDIVNADSSDLWEVVTNPDRVLNPQKYK
jgi:antitoxin (DNA-binding transcriptional repressor) of toxin-antitoxin stability system